MDIVLVAHYLGDLEHPEGNNSRFLYLAKLLKQKGHEVEILTSSFFHERKAQYGQLPESWEGCKLTVIHEPGYPKNVCLQRFYSHDVLSQGMKKYLHTRKKPDVVYAAIPSLSVGRMLASYCKKQRVGYVIDVQDLWPEAFEMVFHVPVVSSVLYAPLRWQANYIYRHANAIAAVSETYVKRAMAVNKKVKAPVSVFLGTQLTSFDNMKHAPTALEKPEGEVWMGYIGTLGNSYDLHSVLEAMVLLKQKKKCENLRFVVMGDGQQREELEAFAGEQGLKVSFTGSLPYPKMVSTLCRCDFAVNPIQGKSAASIINKVGDYAAAALGVVNTQESEEYRALLEQYGAGINCENGNVLELAVAIEQLWENETLRRAMGQGNRQLAEEKFDRGKQYKLLCNLIEMAGAGRKEER